MAETSQKVIRDRDLANSDDETEKKKKRISPAPTTAKVYQLPFSQSAPSNQLSSRNYEYNNRPLESPLRKQWSNNYNHLLSKPVGGPVEIDVNKPKSQEYVALAVKEYNKRQYEVRRTPDKLELLKVKKAFLNYVAGMFYHFTFDAKVTTDGEREKVQTYQAEVWEKISGEVEVFSFKLYRDEQGYRKEVVFWEGKKESPTVEFLHPQAANSIFMKPPTTTPPASSISDYGFPLPIPHPVGPSRRPKKSSSFKKYVAQNSRRQARVDKSLDMIIRHLQSQASGQLPSPEFMSYSHEGASDDEEILLSDTSSDVQ